MKKNIIFLIAVNNKEASKKYGGFDWFNYAIKSWTYWCKNNNAELVIYETTQEDIKKHRITWQRWFDVFEILDNTGIDYDKVFMCDANSIVHWNCPDFFKLIEGDDRIAGWVDNDNLNWIYNSVQGYKNLFNGFNFNINKYVNSNIIFNKTHKDFFKEFKTFYYKNYNELINLQDKIVKRGTDQTPLNYFIQVNNMDVNTSIPWTYNVTHPHRKELFSYNWQLNEDQTPFFIKYGHHWKFSGMAKDQRTELMKKTWDLVKHYYTYNETDRLLNLVNHKDTFKNATSKKFKLDLIEFFKDDKYKDMKVLELGACQGDTTRIFSELFKEVYAVDMDPENVQILKRKCKDVDNVEASIMNVTNDTWDFPQVDVVFVDASHDYPQVAIDIQKCIDYFDKPIIILDDYGNPNNRNIRKSIDDKIEEGKMKVDTKIGEDVGFLTKSGWKMIDREGVICTT